MRELDRALRLVFPFALGYFLAQFYESLMHAHF
jgi:hypothetical protein